MPSFASTQSPSGPTGRASGIGQARGGNSIAGVTLNEPKGSAAAWTRPGGLGPQFNSQAQKFRGIFMITGVTRDSAGAALGNCDVHLFLTDGDTEVDQTISDGSGNFSFRIGNNASRYYLVAYLIGSPDRAGTSLNTLLAA